MPSNFEVAKFHGTHVSILDSHWFARQIIDNEGKVFMCTSIDATAYRADKIKVGPYGTSYLPVYSSLCYAAMAPYRDFMAREAKTNQEIKVEKVHEACHLWVLFHVGNNSYFNDPLSYFYDSTVFRMGAARLDAHAAPPIRYCVLINS